MKMGGIVRSKSLFLILPVLYGLAVLALFGIDSRNSLLSVMSLGFIFVVPGVMGFFTIYLASPDRASSTKFSIFAPWVPIFIFLLVSVLFSLEGWACWIMVLPIFLFAASTGGVLGSAFSNQRRENSLKLSMVMLLPFFLTPLEHLITFIPVTYKAYTYIDINAPADRIWKNVTRVNEIPAAQDKGLLTRALGFPRPVKAELNYLGVGAYREAIFTNGLVFHETVTAYKENEKMVFTIKADPYDIPSTSLDKHVVIGGDYFDVLNGTYLLEKRGENTYRLHLYSHFKLSTNFNFYASWWAKWIMKDIQQNILQIEKLRAEHE